MASFKICVRERRKDGYYPVYIRIIHKTKVGYINTGKMVNDDWVGKDSSVTEPHLMAELSGRIDKYVERLNRIDCRVMTVQNIIKYVTTIDEDVFFSDYARKHIGRLINQGSDRNARNYQLALQHLERFAGTKKIQASAMTSTFLSMWLQSLAPTKQAKEMYPICMRQVWKMMTLEFNDDELGIERVRFNPWPRVKIPKCDTPRKLSIPVEAVREFFAVPIPESKYKEPQMEMARDVTMMVMCLAGINTVDLFLLRKEDYHGGVLHYKRAKTRNARRDEAYIEMRVPAVLLPVMERYLDKDESSPWLFTFRRRFSNSDSFGANVNNGIRTICEELLGLKGTERYCVYTFRHTWATIAQSDLGASLDDVGLAMNHASSHRVTRGYVRMNFLRAWELNERVVDFVFFSDKPSVRNDDEAPVAFKLSYRAMVEGVAYLQGRRVAELTDVGFNNVDEVLARLIGMLPDDVPARAMVTFKLTNMDKGTMAVYHRQQGKGF